MTTSKLFVMVYKNVLQSKLSFGKYFDNATNKMIQENFNNDDKKLIYPIRLINDYYLEYIMQFLAVSITKSFLALSDGSIKNDIDLDDVDTINQLIADSL